MGYLFDALRKADARSAAPDSPGMSGELSAAIPAGFASLVFRPDGEREAAGPIAARPASPAEASPQPMRMADLSGVDDRLVALTEPFTIMAEEYRSIRTGLLARWQQRRNLIHTISSATPQEGKTITSLNMGFSFAELRNRKTLVVEADLRLPQFQALLSLPPSIGLAGLLEHGGDFEAAIQRIGDSSLHILPAGEAVHDQAVQLLSGSATAPLLTRLREKYDHVIIDTPPVLDMADAGILGALSDDVLLVARLERTPRELIERAIHTLASYNAPVAGLIATDRKRHRHHSYYRYGYRYSKYYHPKKAA